MDYQRRVKRLRAEIQKANLSAIICTSWESLWYLTGIEHLYRQTKSNNQMLLVVPEDGEPIFIPTQGFSKSVTVEYPEIQEVLPYSEDKEIYPFKTKWDRVVEVCETYKLRGTQIGLEMEHLPSAQYFELLQSLEGEKLVRADEIILRMRALKDEEELDRMRRAAVLTDKVLLDVVNNELVPGMTERQFANKLKRRALEYSAEVGFVQIFSGYRNYFQNIECTDKKIEEHEIILVDYGICFRGYNTDITRAFCFGKPAPNAVKTCSIVKDILSQATEFIKPGIVTGEVDLFVKKVFENRGFGDKWIHRLGHGMGINYAEWPSLAAPDTTVIEPNMIFAVEPGIYYQDHGIRLEDNIIVHEGGNENLTKTPHDINVL